MKVLFEFDGYEESHVVKSLLSVNDYMHFVSEIYNAVRSIIKYNPDNYTDEQLIVAQNIYDKMHEYLNEANIDVCGEVL